MSVITASPHPRRLHCGTGSTPVAHSHRVPGGPRRPVLAAPAWFARLLIALALVSAHVGSAAQPTLPAVGDFFGPAEFSGAKISPDGNVVGVTGTRGSRDYFATIDLKTGKAQPVVNFDDAEVLNFWWKGTDYIIFVVEYFYGGGIGFRGYNFATKRIDPLNRLNARGATMVNPLVGDPDQIIASNPTNTGMEMFRLNIRKDELTLIQENIEDAVELAPNREGQVLAALRKVNDEWFVWLRATPADKWRELPQGHGPRPGFTPVGVHPDQKRIIGFDATGDRRRLIARDPVTLQDEVLFAHDEVDVDSTLKWCGNSTDIRGASYKTDRWHQAYFLPADQQFAREIDEALPEYSNEITSTTASGDKLVIRSISVAEPERYWLFDRRAGQLSPLASSRPKLAKLPPCQTRYFRFQARDGLPLTALLITPATASAAKPAPTILRTETDPHDEFQPVFSSRTQVLVSRGYAVLQVNHRGTFGYGRKHQRLGQDALHTTMADDLADAVKYAAAQAWLDPRRVALLGETVGGIPAIYAAARNPGVFHLWLNLATGMDPSSLSTSYLLFDFEAERGGKISTETEARLNAYRRSLAPLAAAGKFHVPSFHFYFGSDAGLLDAAALRKQLAGSGTKFEFKISERSLKPAKDLIEKRRMDFDDLTECHTALLDFLSRQLPVD